MQAEVASQHVMRRVRKLCSKHKGSVAELARMSGYNRATVGRIINNEGDDHKVIKLLVAAGKLFGVPVAHFFSNFPVTEHPSKQLLVRANAHKQPSVRQLTPLTRKILTTVTALNIRHRRAVFRVATNKQLCELVIAADGMNDKELTAAIAALKRFQAAGDRPD